MLFDHRLMLDSHELVIELGIIQHMSQPCSEIEGKHRVGLTIPTIDLSHRTFSHPWSQLICLVKENIVSCAHIQYLKYYFFLSTFSLLQGFPALNLLDWETYSSIDLIDWEHKLNSLAQVLCSCWGMILWEVQVVMSTHSSAPIKSISINFVYLMCCNLNLVGTIPQREL